MKKTIIAILLILTVSVSAVFALDGFTFSAGYGFDSRTVKQLKDYSRSMDVELGAKYPIGNGFSAYTDLGIRFVGKGSFDGRNYNDGIMGINVRLGIVYGLRFVNNPSIETYFGGGITYANTSRSASASSFYNIGIGFKFVGAYRINDSIAVTLTEIPEIYLFNRGQFKFGTGNVIAIGTMFKF